MKKREKNILYALRNCLRYKGRKTPQVPIFFVLIQTPVIKQQQQQQIDYFDHAERHDF